MRGHDDDAYPAGASDHFKFLSCESKKQRSTHRTHYSREGVREKQFETWNVSLEPLLLHHNREVLFDRLFHCITLLQELL